MTFFKTFFITSSVISLMTLAHADTVENELIKAQKKIIELSEPHAIQLNDRCYRQVIDCENGSKLLTQVLRKDNIIVESRCSRNVDELHYSKCGMLMTILKTRITVLPTK